jgi:hypothetical protein
VTIPVHAGTVLGPGLTQATLKRTGVDARGSSHRSSPDLVSEFPGRWHRAANVFPLVHGRGHRRRTGSAHRRLRWRQQQQLQPVEQQDVAAVKSSSGHYTGNGTNIPLLSFDVDDSAGTLTNFKGAVRVPCAQFAHSSTQLFSFDDTESVGVDSGGSFSSTFDIPSTGGVKQTLVFAGKLDGHDTATGTLSDSNPTCNTPPDPWTASIDGVARPPIPTWTPSSAPACSPQPCAVNGALTLTVESASVAADSAGPTINGIDLVVTVANNGSTDRTFSPDDVHLAAGGNAYTWQNRTLSLTDSSGSVIDCKHQSVTVPAGQAVSHFDICYLPHGGDPTGESLKLQWVQSGSGTRTLDIGTTD